MLIYYLLIILCLFFTNKHQTHNNRKIFIFILGILFYVIFAFRDFSVGVDTIAYYEHYIDSKNENFEYTFFEPGRYFLNKLFNSIGLSFSCFLMIVGLFVVYVTSIFIYKYSCNPSLSYLFFITIGMFSFYFSGLRQTIAITLILIVYELCYQRHFRKAFFFILLASSFHFSALICFIIPVSFVIKKISIKILLFLLLIPFLILLSTPIIQSVILQKMTIIKYMSHLEEDSSNINIVAYFVIPYSLFAFSTYLQYRIIRYNKGYNNLPFYFASFFYSCFAALSFCFPMISRLSYYFSLPMLIYISNNLLKTKEIPLLEREKIIVSIIICCVIYFVLSTIDGTFGIDNFKFIF